MCWPYAGLKVRLAGSLKLRGCYTIGQSKATPKPLSLAHSLAREAGGDRKEIARFQACPADQCAVDVGNRH